MSPWMKYLLLIWAYKHSSNVVFKFIEAIAKRDLISNNDEEVNVEKLSSFCKNNDLPLNMKEKEVVNDLQKITSVKRSRKI